MGWLSFMLEQLEIQAESDSLETLWLEVNSANKDCNCIVLQTRLSREISIRKNYFRKSFGRCTFTKKNFEE